MHSADGFRPFDPGTQTGPTVLLPAALLLRLIGPDPAVARMVVGLYAAFAFFVFGVWLWLRAADRPGESGWRAPGIA